MLANRMMGGIAVAALGLGLAIHPAKAQDESYAYPAPAYDAYQPAPYDYQDDAYRMGEVTVTAPRQIGRSPIGAPIEVVRASRVVDFADLDLDSAWGQRLLQARIRGAARSACDELDARYPISVDSPGECYADAVHNGMIQASYVTGYPVSAY